MTKTQVAVCLSDHALTTAPGQVLRPEPDFLVHKTCSKKVHTYSRNYSVAQSVAMFTSCSMALGHLAFTKVPLYFAIAVYNVMKGCQTTLEFLYSNKIAQPSHTVVSTCVHNAIIWQNKSTHVYVFKYNNCPK